MNFNATFDHVGLTVSDLDQAVRWYGQALELTVEFEFELPDFQFRGAMMLSRTGYRLELLERHGSQPGPLAANPVEAALTRGYGHICLDVAVVDEAYDALRGAGASERMSPRPSPEPGVRMAYVADPEGNLIELIDRSAVRDRGRADAPAQPHVPIG